MATEKIEQSEFWLVWRGFGGSPTCRHFSKDAALLEAERLAEKYPGEWFYVMKATGGVMCPIHPPRYAKFTRSTVADDGIPF